MHHRNAWYCVMECDAVVAMGHEGQLDCRMRRLILFVCCPLVLCCMPMAGWHSATGVAAKACLGNVPAMGCTE